MEVLLAEFEGVSWSMILLLLAVGFAAGWVDAVVGGGGLLQLPALLLLPGMSPVQALATNKLGSIFGTTTSALTYTAGCIRVCGRPCRRLALRSARASAERSSRRRCRNR